MRPLAQGDPGDRGKLSVYAAKHVAQPDRISRGGSAAARSRGRAPTGKCSAGFGRVTISISNHQAVVQFDLRWLRKFARRALPLAARHSAAPGAPLAQLEAVEISIVSDHAIAGVHERFMQIPGPTDVITFAHGEILISAETGQKNAARYQLPIEHELGLYILHGLLHLNGFDDAAPADAARMRRLQVRLLRDVLGELDLELNAAGEHLARNAGRESHGRKTRKIEAGARLALERRRPQ
jgi:probable rRNA maturation factor